MAQVISTRIMPQPHVQELEESIRNILKTIHRFKLNDSESLAIHFRENVILQCSRPTEVDDNGVDESMVFLRPPSDNPRKIN